MVFTRRQAREDRLAKQQARELEVQSQNDVQSVSQHPSRADTRIEIAPSATGQGTHTRWIRQHPVSAEPTEPSHSQPDEMVDERFVTPAPTSFPIPGAPQKARGTSRMRTSATEVSLPPWKLEPAMHNIEEEPDVDGELSNVLGSPFSGQATRQLVTKPHPQALRQEPTMLVSAEPSLKGSTETEMTEGEGHGLRRAFGPNGTHLYDLEGRAIFVY